MNHLLIIQLNSEKLIHGGKSHFPHKITLWIFQTMSYFTYAHFKWLPLKYILILHKLCCAQKLHITTTKQTMRSEIIPFIKRSSYPFNMQKQQSGLTKKKKKKPTKESSIHGLDWAWWLLCLTFVYRFIKYFIQTYFIYKYLCHSKLWLSVFAFNPMTNPFFPNITLPSFSQLNTSTN